jgi:hypothetical protein
MATSLLISGLFIALFATGLAGGWVLGRDSADKKKVTFTDWLVMGGLRGWIDRSGTPQLYAAYLEEMQDRFDAQRHTEIPKYDWPTKDRNKYLESWTGMPE